MTHASVTGSTLELPRALIQLSVGIETAADLIADLRQALHGKAPYRSRPCPRIAMSAK